MNFLTKLRRRVETWRDQATKLSEMYANSDVFLALAYDARATAFKDLLAYWDKEEKKGGV